MENRLFKVVNKTTTEMPNEPFRFEHALQEYILLHPEFLRLSDQMHEPEITFYEKRSQEFRYDLVINYTDSDDTAIVELKKEEIDDDAIRQIQKYLAAEKELEPDFGILLGTSITKQAQDKIEKSKNLYAIVLNRFDLGVDEVVSTDIYYPQTSSSKDKTKYVLKKLQNEVISSLGKGKLVYEIIKSYIRKYPEKSIEDLNAKFPDSLAKRGPKNKMSIIHVNNFEIEDHLQGRYFKDPLTCADGEILICNQWGIGNIQGMIDKAKELGIKVISLNKQ